ncbi:MAG: hypothetical protein GWO20_06965, partial [Candidatus Korarchaeota archaeon]|nr:hypothetical protein [Candidatus Korarchaeota archaeon]NIU83319.1 hypothetical protein [Candidatus Thorarchaeota archaeon]NIW13656.1 hypothetical protein [Candidatus Thorarchaeota archaeon]NIW51757.1 hypothetical protein [Candidatus Korarchaeota archaeon]
MKEEISKLKSSLDELGEAQKEELKQVIEEDERLLYYLIGQLIRKIDNFRGSKGKNKIFSSFIQNVNPRNIKARFAKDILQGQDYYLEKLTRKDKIEFIF